MSAAERTWGILASAIFIALVAIYLSGLGGAAAVAPEAFRDATPAVLYSENPMNHYTWASAYDSGLWKLRAIADAAIFRGLATNDSLPDAMLEGADRVYAVVDPLDYEHRWGSSPAAAGRTPPGYFVILTNDIVAAKRDCQLEWRGQRIGVLTDTDANFVRAFMSGYRIGGGDYELVRIPMTRWEQLDAMIPGEIDRIITFVIPNSPFHGLLRRQRILAQGFQYVDPARVAAFYPYVRLVAAPTIADLFVDRAAASKSWVRPVDAEGPLFEMRQDIVAIRGGALGEVREGPGREGFITRLEIPPEATDPSYRCYGDLSSESKAACESPYDVIGLPKKGETATVWDQPCFEDADCPFYTPGSGRGGCGSPAAAAGTCEMPVGVRRLGFRRADTSGPFAPFCYGGDCDAGGDADYVFAGDTEARRSQGKETIVALV